MHGLFFHGHHRRFFRRFYRRSMLRTGGLILGGMFLGSRLNNAPRRICVHCGTQVNYNDVYCKYCGNKLIN